MDKEFSTHRLDLAAFLLTISDEIKLLRTYSDGAKKIFVFNKSREDLQELLDGYYQYRECQISPKALLEKYRHLKSVLYDM